MRKKMSSIFLSVFLAFWGRICIRVSKKLPLKCLKTHILSGGGGGGGTLPPEPPTRALPWTQWEPKAAPILWPMFFQIYP